RRARTAARDLANVRTLFKARRNRITNMIRLRQVSLPSNTAKELQNFQDKIDLISDYAAKVAASKSQFALKNKPQNQTFVEIRKGLTKMCAGARRCVYCEDSCADEVEHIKPKNLYP